ncbi:DEAD/DEAH box helicase family protein [Paraburkholderia aspalathi]|nr:helicase C-terminal domain-containing protein [Paraburkholderia aspalathi]MBK3779941.1 DEAD/DEAH box helicase family protein [Paraburkholderia aspalathi]
MPTITAIFEALTHRFKLSPRPSQVELARHTCSALSTGGVFCGEAPTGTGKTLGYLAGAIEAHAHAGTQVPVVVATATVGLQEQILRDDIPRLAEIGAIDPRKVAVAKGRGRYFCPRTAALLEDRKMQDTQMDIFQADKHVADGGVPIALDMLRAWRDKEWDGDRDNWNGSIPECWAASCGASSDTCVNRACEHFDVCPYMNSRARLATAQLIIANHDMVLADLAQRADEQTSTALPPKSYAVIFDEAHNLPDKAVSTKEAMARLSDADWLRKLEPYGEATLNTARIAKVLSKSAGFSPDVFSTGAALLIAELERVAIELASTLKFSISGTFNWGLTAPDEALQKDVLGLSSQALSLLNALRAAAKAYSELAEEASGAEKSFAVRMLAQTHQYQRMAKELQQGLYLFCNGEQLVRWVSRNRDGKVSLHTQPLEGSDVLNELLWRTGFPVAMVSATLQIAGSFKRFISKTGLPGHAVTAALPAVFDYSRGYLHQPPMATEPGDAGFEAEVTSKLEKLFKANVAPGMLVLFTSRESMRRVVRALSEDVGRYALVQDHRPLPELVAQHKERINKGERSMLVGLDSMAEGLDLPGKYCGHVVIPRLPFAVPGNPVEEARREFLGKAWFEEAYLADMLTMLIQACGRLIRRESDHGVISILDKRLSGRRYTATAFAALPDFTRGTRIAEYFEMAKTRGFDLSHGVHVAPKLSVVPTGSPAPASTSPAACHEKVLEQLTEHAEASAVVPPASTARKQEKAPAAHQTGPVVEFSADYPEQALRRLSSMPATTGNRVLCSADDVMDALERVMPHVSGPFADHETQYLSDAGTPCLPTGTPALVWAERQLPQAVMLGLRLRNLPWDDKAPEWLQVLRLRPDLLQYAQVLRSHRRGLADERMARLTAAQCEQQLERGLSSLNYAGEGALFRALDDMDEEVATILSEPHIRPRKDMLVDMTEIARSLARALFVVPF